MTAAISELIKSLSDIASEAGKLATQTTEFADDVENTQNAIRELMDRV
jgi:DNA anti-recombination protein RmuC